MMFKLMTSNKLLRNFLTLKKTKIVMLMLRYSLYELHKVIDLLQLLIHFLILKGDFMNIQQLKYFIEIANTNSLSAAARNLFVTQPTLSLALKKLEGELQTSLFTHNPSPFQLTKIGEYLYTQGLSIVESFDQLIIDIHEMSDETNKKKTPIRLGLPTLFSMQFMKEISNYLEKNPHIELFSIQDGSPILQEKLINGELDVGLVSLPNLHPESLSFEVLETSNKGYHPYVIIPENNSLSRKDELTFKDLKGQRFSSLTTNFMLGRLLLDRSRDVGFEPNVVLYNDDIQVLIHSLKPNNSICILPIEYQTVSMSEGLKWIPLKDKYQFFPIGIALKKDAALTQDISDFIEVFRNN